MDGAVGVGSWSPAFQGAVSLGTARGVAMAGGAGGGAGDLPRGMEGGRAVSVGCWSWVFQEQFTGDSVCRRGWCVAVEGVGGCRGKTASVALSKSTPPRRMAVGGGCSQVPRIPRTMMVTGVGLKAFFMMGGMCGSQEEMAVGVGGEGGVAVGVNLMRQGLSMKMEERWETV